MAMIRVGVFGLGRFGTALVKTLNHHNNSNMQVHIRAVDKDPDRVEAVKDNCDDALIMNLEEEDLLKSQIQNLDIIVIAIGENALPVLLLAHTAMEMISDSGSGSESKPRIMCRAHDQTTRKILKKFGVQDQDIFAPEEKAAERLARRLVHRSSVDSLPLKEDQAIIQIPTPPKWVGKSLAETKIRNRYQVNLLCLQKSGTTENVISPDPDTVFEEGDQLYLLGPIVNLDKISSRAEG